jgi:hypothetical protein
MSRSKLERLVREQRRQVLEQDPMFGRLRRLDVDLVNLDQREITLTIFRCAHFAFDRVARVQIEPANLRGRDVDIVGRGEIRRLRRAQEPESIGQHFERPITVNRLSGLGLFLEDRKHEFLLAHPVGVVDFEARGHLEQL